MCSDPRKSFIAHGNQVIMVIKSLMATLISIMEDDHYCPSRKAAFMALFSEPVGLLGEAVATLDEHVLAEYGKGFMGPEVVDDLTFQIERLKGLQITNAEGVKEQNAQITSQMLSAVYANMADLPEA